MHVAPESIPARLEGFLSRATGGRVVVSGLRPLAGGASRLHFALDITVTGGSRAGSYPSVLRLDLGGKIYETTLDRVEELEVLRLALAAGVPAPRPLWASADPQVLGRGFVILERVEGETIGRRIVKLPELEAARRALPRQMGLALARLHAADPRPLAFLPRPGPNQSPARTALARARREMDRIAAASPVLEAAWRWLWEKAPPSVESVLVHGDFRLGNLVVGADGLRAVLDWEFACAGDPHEDLAWPFVRDWRFGRDELRFGGLSDGEDFLAAYEEESGRRVEREKLRFWEALGNFRWALGCRTQAHRHLSGVEPSVELASLGRRACEMELETLELIGAAAASGGAGAR